jgi:hypothetical protein
VSATLALEAAASSLSDLLPFDVVGQVSGVSGLALDLVGFGGQLTNTGTGEQR